MDLVKVRAQAGAVGAAFLSTTKNPEPDRSLRITAYRILTKDDGTWGEGLW